MTIPPISTTAFHVHGATPPQRRRRRLPDPFPRLTDWSLALVVGLGFVTGLISLISGQPNDWLIFALHGAVGFWLLALLWGKLRRTLPRLLRPRLWDRRTLLGALVTLIVLLALGSGVWWVIGGDIPPLYFNLLGWHIALGFALTALVALHLLARAKPLRARDVRGRRQVLRFGALAVGGALLWPAQQLATQAFRLPGTQERFTGSRDAGDHTGNAFFSTSWVADSPLPIPLDSWRLAIAGAVDHPYSLTYADLLTHDDSLDAILDCTSGFYSLQTWQGARIGALLAAAHPHPDATYVRFVSITGYRWSLPIAEANTALLASLVEGQPLIHDHGAPARLVAPGRRGFQWVKWLTRIEALITPDPGEVLAIHTSSLTPAGRGER
ncbi:MAG: molybdopterin-dependent oxidoreductase [Ktedonobacterales bacterium]